jgi:hypothetical protein
LMGWTSVGSKDVAAVDMSTSPSMNGFALRKRDASRTGSFFPIMA